MKMAKLCFEQESAEVAEGVLHEELWWPKLLRYLCCLLFKAQFGCLHPWWRTKFMKTLLKMKFLPLNRS